MNPKDVTEIQKGFSKTEYIKDRTIEMVIIMDKFYVKIS